MGGDHNAMMKRLLSTGVLLFACTCWAQTITVVGSNFASGATTVKVPAASTVTVPSGQLVLAFGLTQAGNTASFADTLGNTWTKVTGGTLTAHGAANFWYTCNSTGGSDTLTLTNSASADLHIHVLSVAGILTSLCLDKSGVLNGATGTSISVSTSAAITNTNELIIAFFGDWDTNGSWTVTAGNTQQVTTQNSGTGDSAATESKNATSGLSLAVQSISVTNGTSADNKVGVIAAFFAAGGGAAPSGFNKKQKIEQMERGL
jgi:hypothetical protein